MVCRYCITLNVRFTMKLLLLSLVTVLSPFISNSQHNPCRLKVVTDKLANTNIAYTPNVEISSGADKMNIHFYKTGYSIVFSVVVTSQQLFCVDNTSSAVIQFKDGSAVTLKASNTGNCTGNFQSSIYENLSAADIQALATKNIISINIVGKDHQADFKESDTDSQRVQHYFKCIKELEF